MEIDEMKFHELLRDLRLDLTPRKVKQERKEGRRPDGAYMHVTAIGNAPRLMITRSDNGRTHAEEVIGVPKYLLDDAIDKANGESADKTFPIDDNILKYIMTRF